MRAKDFIIGRLQIIYDISYTIYGYQPEWAQLLERIENFDLNVTK